MAKRLFTSESVTEGHPDKICDQISDAVLDAILAKDPQARVACETTVNDRIGVIGTEATVHSGIYTSFIRRQKPDVQVVSKACPLFVPLVEEGWLKDPITMEVARRYLEELLQYDIDTLILGCTHYPLLLPKIKKYMPEGITTVAQGELVAESLKDYLHRHPEMDIKCTKGGNCTYYTTEAEEKFIESASTFLNEAVTVQRIEL